MACCVQYVTLALNSIGAFKRMQTAALLLAWPVANIIQRTTARNSQFKMLSDVLRAVRCCYCC